MALTDQFNAVDAFKKAQVLEKQGDRAKAVELYSAILDLDPDNIEAGVNLGNLHVLDGNYDAAVELFDQVLVRNPSAHPAHNGLGIAHRHLGRTIESRLAAIHACRLANNIPGYWINLGKSHRSANDAEAASFAFQRALHLDPNNIDAAFNLAVVEKMRGNITVSTRLLERVISFSPDFADAHYSLGLNLLLTGDFKRGWDEFEWRWKCEHVPKRQIPGTEWDGVTALNSTVLVHAEQGYGDTLQFMRYLPLVRRRCGTLIFLCQPEIAPLAELLDAVDVVVINGETPPAYDSFVSVMSLPRLFMADPASIPQTCPYLAVPSRHTAATGIRVEQHDENLRVVLVAQGRRTHENDSNRSIPAEALAPLLSTPGVTWINPLPVRQDGLDALEESKTPISSFADTAALLDEVDLVITVDTAIAHLAGALGKMVWILLPLVPDWRWMLRGGQSLWYPTARLFRQKEAGGWENVLTNVASALADQKSALQSARTGRLLLTSAALSDKRDKRFTLTLTTNDLNDPGARTLWNDEMYEGGYERATRALILRCLREGDLLIDCGAHWGVFSIAAAVSCEGVHCMAVEAHPENAARIADEATRQGLADRIETINAAVGSHIGKSSLCLNTSMGHWVDHGHGGVNAKLGELQVSATTIDQLLDDRPALAEKRVIMKLDVEGAEPAVLKGASALIKSGRLAMLIIEKGLSYRDPAFRQTFIKHLTAMNANGFRVAEINEEAPNAPLRPFDPEGPPCNIVLFKPEALRPPAIGGFKLQRESAEKRQTDQDRWTDPTKLEPAWDRRAEAAASFLPSGVTVMDIGCGAMALEEYLPAACRYRPVDMVARDERTEICDLNEGQFPSTHEVDFITVLGVLEYLADVEGFLKRLGETECPIILSYCPSDNVESGRRPDLGWFNDYGLDEFRALLTHAGFSVRALSHEVPPNVIFLLIPSEEAVPDAPTVTVMSYANVGNFGDRLGVHLLNSLLPAGAVVQFGHFRPWSPPKPASDLLILGIGNSLFQPLLTDELINLVEASPKAVGVFGTQYRDAIPRDRLDTIIRGVDYWFARNGDDVRLFGAGHSNVHHLGDWLVDAFPMSRWRVDKSLRIDRSVLRNLPLDRVIQRIQSYRYVDSERLHPLLCALTSAEAVSYAEQFEAGDSGPSGKFRSLLIDIFGVAYRPEVRFDVDRKAVSRYKKFVRENIGSMRGHIDDLLR